MDIQTIIKKLIELNTSDPADCSGDLDTLCDINVAKALEEYDYNIENILESNKNINKFNKQDYSPVWKYIAANFYFLDLLQELLNSTPPENVLSVQHIKSLKVVIKNVVGLGICCNLQPNMPTYKRLIVPQVEDTEYVVKSYNTLAATTYGLIKYFKCIKLRTVLCEVSFTPILSSLYQIIYCPLKKPNTKSDVFVMSPDLYDRFTLEKYIFRKELEYLEESLLKSFYIRETMLLPKRNSPSWLMKAIAQNLNSIITLPQGIETLTSAMLHSNVDYDPNDTAKKWKTLDIIAKLILYFYGKLEFECICEQLKSLINIKDRNGKFIVPFLDLYVMCIKRLFLRDKFKCINVLFSEILNNIKRFTNKDYKFTTDEDVTSLLTRDIHLLHMCFIGNGIENLPIELLMASIGVIFYFATVVSHSCLEVFENELRELLVKFCERDDINPFFDIFLLNKHINGIDLLRNDICLKEKDGNLIVEPCDFKTNIDIKIKSDVLRNICKSNKKLYIHLFLYLLDIIVDYEKYVKSTNNDLLKVEADFVLDHNMQIKLVVYGLLSELSENHLVQNYIKENPIDIIKYLKNALQRILDSEIHKIHDYDSENFQKIFTLAMVLQALVKNSTYHDQYKEFLTVLKPLFNESKSSELRGLLSSIIETLENKKTEEELKNDAKSAVEVAIDDLSDPLLPIRAHGIMTLTKLIESKDSEALKRKNYICNIFQQSLKNDDSYIYLSAINGLAAMGHIFPDIIVNTLTEEYSGNFSQKDAEDRTELRMKLGEILVRVTKTLGDMAPKYKSILLNTFLVGTKDEDPLMRASSLSNLAEVCSVLGYKLGTIVTEILVCVHAIITTDKAAEPRRAALTVIRQLLVGLEVEMITTLKDHILEIYRTLKTIYQGDKDDVMRLHAQLALEELNENVNRFLMATPQCENKIKFVLPDNNK